MAADKMACIGDNKHAIITKIFKIDGSLIGMSGPADIAVAILRWFKGGCKEEDWPDLQYENEECGVLVVSPDGVVKMYGRYPLPMILDQEIHAIGSGRDFALAVMHMGHDPVKAIEVASALDCYTGAGIDVLHLDESKLQ